MGAMAATAAGAGALWLWSGAATGPVPGDLPVAPFDRPGAPARIVAFGTSLTARNAWPDGLAARLTDCLGHPVAVIREAAVGMGSDWGLTRIDAVAAQDPDLVLIEFAANDADLLDADGLAAARIRHVALLKALRTALPEARLMLMTMNPVGGLHRVKRARLAAHHAMYRDLARADDVGGLHPDDAATAAVVVPALAGLIARAAGRPACPADGPAG